MALPTDLLRPRRHAERRVVQPRSSGLPWLLAVGLLVLFGGAAFGVYTILSQLQPNNPQEQAKLTIKSTTGGQPDTLPNLNINPLPSTPEVPAPTPGPKKTEPSPMSDPVKPLTPDPVKPITPDPVKPITPDPIKPITPVDPKKPETPPTPPEKTPEEPVKKPGGDPEFTLPPKKINKADEYHVVLSPENQKRVDQAIQAGAAFLKAKQQSDGGWGFGDGNAAFGSLAALTLLECGVSATDPMIKKAADFTRKHAIGLNGQRDTYELSLAILFLDRLGDKTDVELIRKIALRLIAGQQTDGGWNYKCPLLSAQEEEALWKYLKQSQPVPLASPPKNTFKNNLPPIPPGGLQEPLSKQAFIAAPTLAGLPVVQFKHQPKAFRKTAFPGNEISDNSNTQFAMLALWVARKHDLPVEKSIALVDQRFLSTQNPYDGSWGYIYKGASKTMTCAGLIGLALGHGSYKELLGDYYGYSQIKPNNDPAIKGGLSIIIPHIGNAPADWNQPVKQENLYFVWSVERVAMLYSLKNIGGKDWYSWSAHMLVVNQQVNGSWTNGQYTGANEIVDTCLALLTLKRANFVPDLTDSLKEYFTTK